MTESASQKKWRLVRERQEAKAAERAKAERAKAERAKAPRTVDDRPPRHRRSEETYEDRRDDLGESPDY